MEDKYEKLREILKEKKFPMLYPFKFIIPHNEEKMIRIKRIFDETAEISTRASKNGKYTSITIKQMMLTPDDIITRYKDMQAIEGVISL